MVKCISVLNLLIVAWVSTVDAHMLILDNHFRSGVRLNSSLSNKTQLHSWKRFGTLSRSDTEIATTNVYFVRHGESIVNEWEQTHDVMFPFDPEAGFWDGGLTEKGIQQAVLIQKIISRIGLQNIPKEKIQLASSLNIRAFDTLIISTAQLWNKWVNEGASFLIHEVPAAMALDSNPYARRKLGVAVDDPVRWQDSALAGNISLQVRKSINPDSARAFFYQTEEDQQNSPNFTMKNAQVLAAYERSVPYMCNPEQMEAFIQYLYEVARTGKEHIVIGMHSGNIACLTSATDFMPNGSVLHIRLQVSDGHKPQGPLQYSVVETYVNPMLSA